MYLANGWTHWILDEFYLHLQTLDLRGDSLLV